MLSLGGVHGLLQVGELLIEGLLRSVTPFRGCRGEVAGRLVGTDREGIAAQMYCIGYSHGALHDSRLFDRVTHRTVQ